MENRVLILGGGGFLGWNVARGFASRGVPIRLFGRSLPAGLEEFGDNIDYVLGDALDEKALSRAVAGCSAVYYFLGFSVPASSNMVFECETSLKSVAMVLDAMCEHGVSDFFFPSSGGTVYGETGNDGVHVETDKLMPECDYGLGKKLAESMIRYYSQQHGLRHVVARISNPYGWVGQNIRPQGVIDVSLSRVRKHASLELWGDGKQIRDFIFIDDLVEIICALYEKQVWNETFNIGSGKGTSILEALDIVANTTGQSLVVRNNDRMYSGVARSVLDISKLQGVLGQLSFTPVQEGVRMTWERTCAPQLKS